MTDECEYCWKQKEDPTLFAIYGAGNTYIPVCIDCQRSLVQHLIKMETPDQLRRRIRDVRGVKQR